MARTQLPGDMGMIDWTGWTRGLVAALIGGGAGAVTSGFGNIIVDPKDFNIYTGKLWAVMGACFLINGVLSMMAYLHNKPIPEIISSSASMEHLPGGGTIAKTSETRIPVPVPKEGS